MDVAQPPPLTFRALWENALFHYYAPRRVALNDLKALGPYPCLWAYCEWRGCVDDKGPVCVSLEILEELSAYFGPNLEEGVATFTRLAQQPWFTDGEAFVETCKTPYQTDPLYGICFGPKAPTFVVLSWTQKGGVSREEAPAGKSLEEIALSKKDEGFICDPQCRWGRKMERFELDMKLCVEAQAFVEGKEFPAYYDPFVGSEKSKDGDESEARQEFPIYSDPLERRKVDDEPETRQDPKSGDIENNNNAPAPSEELQEEKKKPIHQIFSGLGYRFVRELNANYPDRKEVEWSRVWQWALSLPTHNEFAKEQKEIIFSAVVSIFTATAKPFAKLIIDESFLDEHERTINPDPRFGGIAGGQKFVQGSQLFKFSQDVCNICAQEKVSESHMTRKCICNHSAWIYGGSKRNDSLGMKSAGHELKSTQALIDAGISQLNYPLMAVFTYRGKRVLCSSLLPVKGKETLVQGKDNIKDKMRVPPANVESVMAMMGGNLFIGKSHAPVGEEIYGPFDMEVHLGHDGLLYMIDAARLFPPEYRGQSSGNRLFYQLLRPELLRKAGRMLLPDAVLARDKEGVKDLTAVTKMLDEEIAQLTRELNTGQHMDKLTCRDAVKGLLHGRGINMRHLRDILRGVNGDCAARDALQFVLDWKRSDAEVSCKTLVFPRELAKDELERILAIQDASLKGPQRMQMIPRLLQLGAIVGPSVPLMTVEMEGTRLRRVSGDHPLVKAFEICEQCDMEFEKSKDLPLIKWPNLIIAKCSYLTLNVMYEICRLAFVQEVDLAVGYPGSVNLYCLSFSGMALMDTPLKSRIERLWKKEDDVQLGFLQAAVDGEWVVFAQWAQRFGRVEASYAIAAEFGAVDFIRPGVIQRDVRRNSSLLVVAGEFGHPDAVRLLIDNEADVNASDEEGEPVLAKAAREGHLNVVRLLVEHKADLIGCKGLICAAEKGHLDIVRHLIDHEADVNAGNETGSSALIWASQNGHVDIIRLLIDHRADVNAPGLTSLMRAASGGSMEIARLLVEHRADVNAVNDDWLGASDTALMFAADGGSAEIAQLLIEHGADVKAVDNNGHSALVRAAKKRRWGVARLLIEHGADVNATDENWSPVLIRCAETGSVDIARQLIEAKADVNAADEYGYTPLVWAAWNGHIDVARYLVEHGADVNTASKSGKTTALMKAAESGHVDIVRLLIDHGADVNSANKSRNTALDIAKKLCHDEVVKLLEAIEK